MEEAASLEVGLADLFRVASRRHAQQLVVRQPVDPAVGVLDELGVARRAVPRLRVDDDVQAVESARVPPAGRSPSFFHSTMPQETSA